jgi:hypothetical protein
MGIEVRVLSFLTTEEMNKTVGKINIDLDCEYNEVESERMSQAQVNTSNLIRF